MTARGDVAAALAPLPGWTVRPFPWTPADVRSGKVSASVWRTELEAGSAATLLAHQVTINVYVAPTMDERAEDELDGRLDEALVALQAMGSFAFARAVRMVFADGAMAGWQITGAMGSDNIYRTQVIKQTESETP